MTEKILLVDDETAILQGYQRLLRSEFQVDTVVGGPAALLAIEQNGPYAVVVSDMRMPQMNGVQLLARVKSIAPDTIRIMLTGNADLETAMNAVNEGSIFRFLTKPCNKETMGKILTAGLVQYRLVTAEKDLLEKTLSGCIRVLTEVLSLVNPAAFGRAMRVRRYVGHVAQVLRLANPWRFEIAAMMSQLGCVTLDPATVDAVYSSQELSPEEQQRYDVHPMVARDLLRNIPRMEPIAWMIAHQNQPAETGDHVLEREAVELQMGAEILQVALEFDDMVRRGGSKTEAGHLLSRRHGGLDPDVFQALVELETEKEERPVRASPIEELTSGMTVEQDVRDSAGTLIVAKGQEISFPVLLKLRSLRQKGTVAETITVSVPAGAAEKPATPPGMAKAASAVTK